MIGRLWHETHHINPQEQCQTLAPVADIATAASKLSLNTNLLAAFSFADRKPVRTDDASPDRSPNAASSAEDRPVADTHPREAAPEQPPPSPAALQTRVRVALLVLDRNPARACQALKMLRRLVHDEPEALQAVVQEDLFRLVPRHLPAFAANAAAVDNACKLLGQVLRALVLNKGEDDAQPSVSSADLYLFTLLTMQVRVAISVV